MAVVIITRFLGWQWGVPDTVPGTGCQVFVVFLLMSKVGSLLLHAELRSLPLGERTCRRWRYRTWKVLNLPQRLGCELRCHGPRGRPQGRSPKVPASLPGEDLGLSWEGTYWEKDRQTSLTLPGQTCDECPVDGQTQIRLR